MKCLHWVLRVLLEYLSDLDLHKLDGFFWIHKCWMAWQTTVYKRVWKPSQKHSTFQCNTSQHCWIVLWYVVKELAKRTEHLTTPKNVSTKIWPFSNLIQHHQTSRNVLLQVGKTCATHCPRQCRKMLHWSVACVWPGFRQLDGIDCDNRNQSDCIICDKRLMDLK